MQARLSLFLGNYLVNSGFSSSPPSINPGNLLSPEKLSALADLCWPPARVSGWPFTALMPRAHGDLQLSGSCATLLAPPGRLSPQVVFLIPEELWVAAGGLDNSMGHFLLYGPRAMLTFRLLWEAKNPGMHLNFWGFQKPHLFFCLKIRTLGPFAETPVDSLSSLLPWEK